MNLGKNMVYSSTFITPSPFHEVLEVSFNILVLISAMIALFWTIRKNTFEKIRENIEKIGFWKYIKRFEAFGVSIETKSEKEAENFSDIQKEVIIWATCGKRPELTINSLENKGYSIEEIDPLEKGASGKISRATSGGKVPIFITNLKHGDDYHAGKKFTDEVKDKYPESSVIIFTSKTAKTRRKSHLSGIKMDYIATNEPELETIFRDNLKLNRSAS